MEINLTTSYVGFLSLAVFFVAYAVVMAEEFSHLRKSKPVILSAAIIWGIIAFYFSGDKSYSKEKDDLCTFDFSTFDLCPLYNCPLDLCI